MALFTAGVKTQGLNRIRVNVRQVKRRGLPDELGRAHKQMGVWLIGQLDPRPTPAAVGMGRGAAVRPSATKGRLVLRAGGAHRKGTSPQSQWGKNQVWSASPPPRPYIIGTARKHQETLVEMYRPRVLKALAQIGETK